jgi:hypothetical protein
VLTIGFEINTQIERKIMGYDQMKTVKNEIARQIWIADFEAKNPGATKEDVSEAWRQASSDFRKSTAKALNRLERKKGITIVKQFA